MSDGLVVEKTQVARKMKSETAGMMVAVVVKLSSWSFRIRGDTTIIGGNLHIHVAPIDISRL